MILLAILIVLFFAVVILFAFPVFSPIPYFPSNKKDMQLILAMLKLHDKQMVIDLGAGDGAVIMAAADAAKKQSLSTLFVAVEINPVLLAIMHLRRLFHRNRKNIYIASKSMFTFDYDHIPGLPPSIIRSYDLTFYLYISPWRMDKALAPVRKQVTKYEIVSYYYEVPGLSPVESTSGVHNLHRYSL